jgi:glycosyltransferase involved in cell wall biosynthesis
VTVDLSVVAIARNEEQHIGECLDSCFRALHKAQGQGVLRSYEVILVDSASTDRTVEIAKVYPVTIVQLPEDWPLSAAAGRHVGARRACGELLFFVDGDSIVAEDWLPAAVHRLRADPLIAAASGKVLEESGGDSVLERYMRAESVRPGGAPEAVSTGLFRRKAYEAVGGMHPYLRGGEDRELAHRLRNAGFRLVKLDMLMSRHHMADVRKLSYTMYYRSVYVWSFGDGQAFRISHGVPSIAAETRVRYLNIEHLRNHWLGLNLLLLTLVNILVVLLPSAWPLLFVDVGVVAILAAVRISRGLTWREMLFPLHVVPYSIIRQSAFVLGFLTRPRDPNTYPTGERILKAAPPDSAGPSPEANER